MKDFLLIVCSLFTLLLSGCATYKTLEPITGSKADGTVTLAYEYGLFEKPQIDWNLANIIAKSRCAAWGYRNAQAFGGQQNHCIDRDCEHVQVNVTYQCIN